MHTAVLGEDIKTARFTKSSVYVSIRQHTSAYVSIRDGIQTSRFTNSSVYVSIRRHTSAYISYLSFLTA